MLATHQYILEGKALPCPYNLSRSFFKLVLSIFGSEDHNCIVPSLLPLLAKAIDYFFIWKSLISTQQGIFILRY
ncbi:hypothetical protein NIES2107_15680 [Nostoc carneum NIES-2107]|nr:hypothetical protein NIES2107_15680 [Nostoc carneum NIES-2107]